MNAGKCEWVVSSLCESDWEREKEREFVFECVCEQYNINIYNFSPINNWLIFPGGDYWRVKSAGRIDLPTHSDTSPSNIHASSHEYRSIWINYGLSKTGKASHTRTCTYTRTWRVLRKSAKENLSRNKKCRCSFEYLDNLAENFKVNCLLLFLFSPPVFYSNRKNLMVIRCPTMI